MQATVFSKDNCPFCVKAIALLESKGYELDIAKIKTDEDRRDLIERVEAASGITPKTMPQIFLGEEYIGGFDQLKAWFAAQNSVA